MGPKSLAKNAFRKLCNELAVNYDDPPECRHGTDAVDELFGRSGLLSRVGLWPTMRRLQQQLIGLREMFLRIDWSVKLRRPVVRLVTPDVVLARADDSAPNEPVEVRELRWRYNVNGGAWCWDVLSIEDPAQPVYKIVEARWDGKDGPDVTVAVLGAPQSGDAYPFRWTQGDRGGEPFLPYILYHAMRRECLFDPYEGVEVVDGSLDVATGYTFLQHGIFKASWPQRWAMGCYVRGTVSKDTDKGRRSEVPTDPTSLLHLEVEQGVTNPQVGQWGSSIDVESLARTIGMLEKAVSDFDGLDMSHIVHGDTANPWSAEALMITREGKRQAQERYKSELRPSDLETIEKLVAVENLATGDNHPESDFVIGYRTLPLSREEATAAREENRELIAEGRRSIVEAYQLEHPGCTYDEAVDAIEKIAEVNEKLRPGAKGPDEKPDPNAPGADGAAKAADTALNGAQVSAAQAIVLSVATRQLPRESGLAQLQEFFNLAPEAAERIMGEVGRSFFVEAPSPAANPNNPPAPPAGA